MIGVPDNCGFGFWKCRGGGNKWVFKRQVEQEFSPFFGEKKIPCDNRKSDFRYPDPCVITRNNAMKK